MKWKNSLKSTSFPRTNVALPQTAAIWHAGACRLRSVSTVLFATIRTRTWKAWTALTTFVCITKDPIQGSLSEANYYILMVADALMYVGLGMIKN